jgi:hypothetical protein
MPRKWLETVHPWTPLQTGTWYALRVAGIEKCADPPSLRVQLEFLHADQAGRTHTAVLRLPIRPAGLTTDFVRACALEAAPGKAVAPQDTIGRTIQAQFEQNVTGEPEEVVHFGPHPDNAPAVEQSATSAPSPGPAGGR